LEKVCHQPSEVVFELHLVHHMDTGGLLLRHPLALYQVEQQQFLNLFQMALQL
jgi:hypothetical protein